jgi:hypothetical protein
MLYTTSRCGVALNLRRFAASSIRKAYAETSGRIQGIANSTKGNNIFDSPNLIEQ